MNVHAFIIVDSQGRSTALRNVVLEDGVWSSIGREPPADIVLPSRRVSRTHARISVQGGKGVVEDLSSRNGTHLVDAEGSESRLSAHTQRMLEPTDSVKIGPYRLIPCSLMGSDVLLSASALYGDAVDDPIDFESGSTQTTASALEPATAGDALMAFREVLARDYDGKPLSWILDGLVALCRARRGFLFTFKKNRFVRVAERGVDGPIVLSERFLRATARHRAPLSVTTGVDLPESLQTRSLEAQSEECRLTGVPIIGSDGETIAVGYLETEDLEPIALEDLGLFGRSIAPIIELHAELEREQRRRESLEFRLQPVSAPGLKTEPGAASPKLIGRNRQFLECLKITRRAARTNASVILRGPSGSGKEELAKLLHECSARSDQPLVMINAANLSPELIESQLFGHERGAFTGAISSQAGAFERADGGTLFLDEIGDLDLTAQAKILRVIETGDVQRVGRLGAQPRRVDVRLVAATHRNLEEMVETGQFRQDLYFRLNVIQVTLPPLAERPEDILSLANFFLQGFRRPDGESVQGLTPLATRVLSTYAWPGNIRELRNVLERAVVLDSDGVIDVDDLMGLPVPDHSTGSVPPKRNDPGDWFQSKWTEARKQFERRFFELALSRNRWCVEDTARQIDVTTKTVRNKMREHGINRD
jgi:DNA-binding NtrC family response regulator